MFGGKAIDEDFRWQCIFLPDNGAFFVNYIITSAFIGTSLELIRFPELFMYILRLGLARCVLTAGCFYCKMVILRRSKIHCCKFSKRLAIWGWNRNNPNNSREIQNFPLKQETAAACHCQHQVVSRQFGYYPRLQFIVYMINLNIEFFEALA